MARTAQLCPPCQELFSQPRRPPSTRDSVDFRPFARLRRRGSSVFESANSGCRLCLIVWGETSSVLGDGFEAKDAVISPRIVWNEERRLFVSLVYRLDTSGRVYPELLAVGMYPKTSARDQNPDCPRPPNSADSYQSMASRWLFECASRHEKCRVRVPAQASSWLPTRLIDVGDSWSTQDPRLIISTSELGSPFYISLTHRWTTDNILRLTGANIGDLVQCIPLADLPHTFRDAVQFCRGLGIRYLWIDSLCIIQDSAADWLEESSNMGKVYEYSFCNIAATLASQSGDCGLFCVRDPQSITPNTVHVKWRGHEGQYIFFKDNHWFESLTRASLNRRGWVFQERLLSPRTFHFSSQLFWECRTLRACETYPAGLPFDPSNLGNDLDQSFPETTKSWREDLQQNQVDHWDLLIQMFCRCYLTQRTDRLAAIAGIASQSQPLLNDQYLAGLWRKQLPCSLLWKLENMVRQENFSVTRPKKYRGPSWTWASLDFEAANIEIPDRGGIDRFLAEVIDAEIETDTGQPYSNVTGGYILILGRLGKVKLSELDDPEWRGDRGGHYTFEYSFDVQEERALEETYLYCLPIMTHDRANRNPFSSLEVHCLLLQQLESGSVAFTRVGHLRVLQDWEAETSEQLRWITDFAQEEAPNIQQLDLLMIY